MYVPPSFSMTDRTTLFEFIEQHNFGMLVTSRDNEPLVSHLPLALARKVGPWGELTGHMARANPQWQTTDAAVLVVFAGPHAYISPSWYASEKAVPTWNYVAVHVYGRLHVVRDEESTLKILREMVQLHEESGSAPWSVSENETFVRQLIPSVAAFRIEIARIEGQWKLSQNHPRPRLENVVNALAQRRDENSQKIAALMAERIDGQA